MRVRKLGIVGAGSMGSGIAALAASVGVPVVLLDIAGDDGRDGPARRGVERALKARPPAFLDPDLARVIETGNIEDDLALLAGCDWVLEAIPERPDLKRALFERLEDVIAGDTIITSNTSGIPMTLLTQGRTDAFRSRFLGTHFFNPPRFMRLLELIPTEDTDPAAVRSIDDFATRLLGKGVVLAKDAPGFIANRIGLYGTLQVCRLMEVHDLSIDEVDFLTGPAIGRPKSATFRTLDIAGLDVVMHAAEGIGRTAGEDWTLPDWMARLVAEGKYGEKSGGGCYRRVGKEIETLDWRTGEYRPRQQPDVPELRKLKDSQLPERLLAVFELPGGMGAFSRELFARTAHYTLLKAPELAYDLVSVDRAMEWGYGWEAGPIRQLDLVGLDRVRALLTDLGLDEPELLRVAGDRFYEAADRGVSVVALDGTRETIETSPETVSAGSLRRAGRIVEENDSAALLDLGDGVGLLEFRSKMGTMGAGVLEMMRIARDWLEGNDRAGLVLGHDDPRAFSAGANLVEVLEAARAGRWDDLESFIGTFQDTILGLRGASRPVVAAPFGMTLGGGAELVLQVDRVQAHGELNIGLVESGVGLIPAGGGTKEMLFRFHEDLSGFDGVDPFLAVKRAFKLIALATVSTSAHDARKLGFLRDGDRITMNRDRLIAAAKAAVLFLAPEYVPPVPRRIQVLGDRALGNLRYAVWAMREAGQITAHDVTIGEEIARVLCGGSGQPREVSEREILDLEREAFLRLLGTEKTQERIAHTLKTGKPLRN